MGLSDFIKVSSFAEEYNAGRISALYVYDQLIRESTKTQTNPVTILLTLQEATKYFSQGSKLNSVLGSIVESVEISKSSFSDHHYLMREKMPFTFHSVMEVGVAYIHFMGKVMVYGYHYKKDATGKEGIGKHFSSLAKTLHYDISNKTIDASYGRLYNEGVYFLIAYLSRFKGNILSELISKQLPDIQVNDLINFLQVTACRGDSFGMFMLMKQTGPYIIPSGECEKDGFIQISGSFDYGVFLNEGVNQRTKSTSSIVKSSAPHGHAIEYVGAHSHMSGSKPASDAKRPELYFSIDLKKI